MNVTRSVSFVLAFSIFIFPAADAQQATPTNQVLSRVLMIESAYGRGTTFSVDVDQREYWITAKHVITGAEHPPYGSVKDKTVMLRVLNPNVETQQWLLINFSVIDPGADIDIVALAAPKPLLADPLPSEPAGLPPNLLLGSDCEFLGFPYGGSWRAKFDSGKTYWMPYTKHCTVSAVTTETPTAWILDGINNVGFSGGPVIFHTGPEQRIFAVISGYHLEPAEVVSSATSKNKPPKKQPSKSDSHFTAQVNSGFIVAYAIDPVIDAIHKNPIGPLRISFPR